MVNTSNVDGQGNIVKKPEVSVQYNTNMGGANRMDQQLHGIQVLRNTYRWYQKIFLPVLEHNLGFTISQHVDAKQLSSPTKWLQQ